MELRRHGRHSARRGAATALLAAATLAVAGCAGVEIPETDEGLRELLEVYGPLSGRVVEKGSDQGVEGAEVVLRATPRNEANVTLGRDTTSRSGAFEMDDFGPTVQRNFEDERPPVEAVVYKKGSRLTSRHASFDWDEYLRSNDYELRIVVERSGGGTRIPSNLPKDPVPDPTLDPSDLPERRY